MTGIDRVIRDRKTRLWIYGIATAALALLGVYGVLSGDEIAAWALLAANVTGLAAANVPGGDPAPAEYDPTHD